MEKNKQCISNSYVNKLHLYSSSRVARSCVNWPHVTDEKMKKIEKKNASPMFEHSYLV